MFHDHGGPNPAAGRKRCFDLHPSWLRHSDEVIQYHVGDPLVEGTMVSILLQVQFQRLEFKAAFVSNVCNCQSAKVRLTCFRTD